MVCVILKTSGVARLLVITRRIRCTELLRTAYNFVERRRCVHNFDAGPVVAGNKFVSGGRKTVIVFADDGFLGISACRFL